MDTLRDFFASPRIESSDGERGSAPIRTIALILASIVWLCLYLWLGRRLWQTEGLLGNPANLALATLCVLLGVAIALGWIVLLPRWRAWGREQWQSVEWPALSEAEVQALSPSDFESYVAYRLFERYGFTVENTRDVKDGGVDILVVDPLGRQSVVQCKRYTSTVGAPTVRDLYGTMIHEGATRAYLVVSGRISREAHEWAEGKPITLIDGERLAAMASADVALDARVTRGEGAGN